jgi:hypothetical protein
MFSGTTSEAIEATTATGRKECSGSHTEAHTHNTSNDTARGKEAGFYPNHFRYHRNWSAWTISVTSSSTTTTTTTTTATTATATTATATTTAGKASGKTERNQLDD